MNIEVTPELKQALATQGYELTKKALCAPICKRHRLTKTRLRYPICKRDIEAGVIVLFDGPYSGKFLWTSGYENISVGEEYATLTSCHDAECWQGWQDWPYDHERNLFHGQPVWAWDDSYVSKFFGFYDAINETVFMVDGNISTTTLFFENYQAFDPSDYKEWMFEAFGRLDFSEVD